MSLYYGQHPCSITYCKNKSYYEHLNKLYCGVHSKRAKMWRKELPKMPIALATQLENDRIERIKQDIESARLENVANKKRGTVVVDKLKMMQLPPEKRGFLNVFPNNRHQNRKDGFGCSSLSPMRLGPVVHGQPDLPDAKNIENFHQGSKCFRQEIDEKGEPGPLFFENQKKFFQDDEPHRHKYVGDQENKNIPLFFVWKEKGVVHKLDYVTSRQFYCTFYERLVQNNSDLAHLRLLLDNGTNIQIVGYDGRPIDPSDIDGQYLNPNKPFGHELVLYTLLVVEKKESFPWNKYKTFSF